MTFKPLGETDSQDSEDERSEAGGDEVVRKGPSTKLLANGEEAEASDEDL